MKNTKKTDWKKLQSLKDLREHIKKSNMHVFEIIEEMKDRRDHKTFE